MYIGGVYLVYYVHLIKMIDICVPSCGRPDKLRNLILSLNIIQDKNLNSVLIINTTPKEDVKVIKSYHEICAEFGINQLLVPNAGTSEAR